tara:strand:- start:2073 stop:4586 length:2514 start_codon:yes stop_codon:yes gene_type:complete
MTIDTLTNQKKWWIASLLSMPRHVKKMVQVIFDLTTLFASYYFSIWLALAMEGNKVELILGLIFVFTTVVTFKLMKIYRVIVRFSGLRLLEFIVFSHVISVCTLALVSELFDYHLTPLFLVFLFFTSVFCVAGGRLLARKVLDFSLPDGRKVLIYGVDKTAIQVMTSINREPGYHVLGFIDNGEGLVGGQLHGVPVISESRLEAVVESDNISLIVLCAPEQTIVNVRLLLNRLESLPVSVKIAPKLPDFLNEKLSNFNDLEEVRVEDFVGRESVLPDETLLSKNIIGKVVLITGAGGSIGSELCRQVIARAPKKLIMVELNELALFNIQQALSNYTDRIIPVLGSISDDPLMEELLINERVDTVYHAAAYKHVPLVESNPFAAIYNNIFGTRVILEASIRAGVKSFTLVSTDKAVRPTNIMGATKRIAEVLCQSAAAAESGTAIAMVRFGNVIGSSGSAIPKFREQIRTGGPVTVTHPDITRFFMGIPEASELLLQASSMATGGEVFVLDMGEPVKIIDLVKRLIRFSGKIVGNEGNSHLNPIDIVYTGLRPGEKLYEELLISGEAQCTIHPKIMMLTEQYPEVDAIDRFMKDLAVVCKGKNIETLRSLLSDLDIGYCYKDIYSATVRENSGELDAPNGRGFLGFENSEISPLGVHQSYSRVGVEIKKPFKELAGTPANSLKQRLFRKLLHRYFLLSRGLTMGVRCVILNREREVLLVKHTYIAGWHLPGGGVDIGETVEEAIVREVQEETLFHLIESPQLVSVYFCNETSNRDHVILFVATKFLETQSELESFEISESKFFPIENLPDEIDEQTKRWMSDAILKSEKGLLSISTER